MATAQMSPPGFRGEANTMEGMPHVRSPKSAPCEAKVETQRKPLALVGVPSSKPGPQLAKGPGWCPPFCLRSRQQSVAKQAHAIEPSNVTPCAKTGQCKGKNDKVT